ncbi:hypothetical protein COLO4_30087 [Corchorus olitorius]|uniref:Uncharacterized protein n=1 Tax=Corchorus olitorius TaxID=93759 RepID=A0A1R3HBE5_9ROSI|nr:hypothetical protein COLO4_30087 [Corchorus olitorius]
MGKQVKEERKREVFVGEREIYQKNLAYKQGEGLWPLKLVSTLYAVFTISSLALLYGDHQQEVNNT